MANVKESNLIQIHCIPENHFALSGVLNTKKIRFDIETKAKDQSAKRTPLNIALILDRSGSMEGNDKLTYAKRAVISVLNLLHDDDIVHLVVYDTDVDVIFENARASTRQHLYSIVDSICTAGSTNIAGAIEMGASLIEKHSYQGYSRRMFLFSDGQANVGMKTAPELSGLVAGYNKKGILTDSFGIGADFDGEIMKGIADAGGSRFFFLESAHVIEPLVTKALMSVFGVCGSQARLIVRGQNGAVVTKIWGHDDLIAGASLGDLHESNLRSILCEFTTAGTMNAAQAEVESLTYELRYLPPNNLESEPITIRNTLSLKFTNDESLVAEIDPRVQTMHATQTAADMDKVIAEYVKNRRVDDALELVTKQIELLKSVVKYDDERGVIALLIRLAEKLHTKINDKNMNEDLVYQAYSHQNYLKRQCSIECMAMYDD